MMPAARRGLRRPQPPSLPLSARLCCRSTPRAAQQLLRCRSAPASTAPGAALAIDGGSPTVVPSSPLPTIANNSGRSVGAEEQAACAAVLESGNLAYITGTEVKEFQRAFGELYGTTAPARANLLTQGAKGVTRPPCMA